ncbi:hypothetical protein XELAEV_18037373mg [Xenopus laevis]|uniref:Secreted protein n=1 Tax=Xenopus laevis TaxID=8355 RepID=A0A974CCM3_XENLA|nr:hypothetical protein XELAEV_18037373mg [Xenopus laevis]
MDIWIILIYLFLYRRNICKSVVLLSMIILCPIKPSIQAQPPKENVCSSDVYQIQATFSLAFYTFLHLHLKISSEAKVLGCEQNSLDDVFILIFLESQ